MEQLWQVLGRSFIDNAFAVDTLGNAQADDVDPNTWEDEASKLTGLARHLHGHKYRLSRWELVEVNRIFFTVNTVWPDLANSPFQQIADAWAAIPKNVSLRPTELWSLLGLASIDENFADRIFAAASVSLEQLLVELAKPPAYDLELAELTALTSLLTKASVRMAHDAIHPKIWVYREDERQILKRLRDVINAVDLSPDGLRDAPCSAGHTRDKVSKDRLTYFHISAPLIDSLAAEALSLELT